MSKNRVESALYANNLTDKKTERLTRAYLYHFFMICLEIQNTPRF